MTTDDALRQAYVSYSREAVPDGHLEPEELWRLAAGELAATESRALIDHLSRCPACAEDLRVTRELTAEAVASAPADGVLDAGSLSRGPRAGGWWMQGLAAAAILATVAVGLSWRTAPPDETPFRQGQGEVVRSLVDAERDVPRSDARLRWAGPEGARYDLVVTSALEVIVEVEGLAATDYSIPPERLAELPPATVLRWHVEALLPGGERIPSQTFDLRLADE